MLVLDRTQLQRSPLRVGSVDDPMEREAEAVADRVIRMPSPSSALVQRCPGGCPDDEVLSRQPAGEHEEEEELVQAAAAGSEDLAVAPKMASAIQAEVGGGSPLPPLARRFFGPRFGADFSAVRVHHDAASAQMAAAVKARAFTVGSDLFFGSGEWAPGTPGGDRLIAHELAHVVQQGTGRRGYAARRSGCAKGQAGAPCPSPFGGEEQETVMPYRLQRYALEGFPAAEESLMHAAIPKAEFAVFSCKPKRAPQTWGWGVAGAIGSRTYKFVDDASAPCGWTFPSSWYIEIGKAAFNHSACCKLESTIAHEASHTQWYTEGRARKLECDCFGCSC